MNLPQNINVLPIHSVKLNVMGKKVNFNPFTVQQERGLIIAMEEENADNIIKNYEEILKGCLKEDIDWNNLSMIDYLTLVLAIRSKSKGENIDLTKKSCDSCQKNFDFSVSIDDSMTFTNADCLKEIVKITDELSFEIAPMNYRFLYGLEEVKTELDMYIHTAAHAISKVFYQNNIYKATPEELKESVIVNLRQVDLENIFKTYNKLIAMHLEVIAVCPHCAHEDKMVIKNFLAC